MAILRSLCLYCGSRSGRDGAHAAVAARLGAMLGERGVRLVFGGGRRGLMGIAADAALAAGAEVVGVIPEHLLDAEAPHPDLSELFVVDTMHARKQKMFELADAFVILPGGLGTLDEAFEIITWRQLRLHDKPIVLLDSAGYWRPLRTLIGNLIEDEFASQSVHGLYRVVARVDEVFEAIAAAPEPRRPAELKRL